jgi:hypothetical protein
VAVDAHDDRQEAHRQRSGELSVVGYTDAPVTNAYDLRRKPMALIEVVVSGEFMRRVCHASWELYKWGS